MKTSYRQAIALYEQWVQAGQPADRCQCCGARIQEGLKGCFELFAQLPLQSLAQAAPSSASTFSVDAHALQHSEIHGKKNNAAHLLRLCWLFEYDGAAQLSAGPAWWQRYLSRPDIPVLTPPADRGAVTVVDVARAQSPEEYLVWTERWARAVYAAWAEHHPWARRELERIWSR